MSASVGAYTMPYTTDSPRNVPKSATLASTHTSAAPITCDSPRNFSVANQRSATWPAMNGPTTAPAAPPARMYPHWSSVNCRCPRRNGYRIGSHAPQIAYWRNIITDKRGRMAVSFMRLRSVRRVEDRRAACAHGYPVWAPRVQAEYGSSSRDIGGTR